MRIVEFFTSVLELELIEVLEELEEMHDLRMYTSTVSITLPVSVVEVAY